MSLNSRVKTQCLEEFYKRFRTIARGTVLHWNKGKNLSNFKQLRDKMENIACIGIERRITLGDNLGHREDVLKHLDGILLHGLGRKDDMTQVK